MTLIKVPKTPHKPGTCGKRPSLQQNVWDAMAPPCTRKPRHKGKHSWETDRWRVK